MKTRKAKSGRVWWWIVGVMVVIVASLLAIGIASEDGEPESEPLPKVFALPVGVQTNATSIRITNTSDYRLFGVEVAADTGAGAFGTNYRAEIPTYEGILEPGESVNIPWSSLVRKGERYQPATMALKDLTVSGCAAVSLVGIEVATDELLCDGRQHSAYGMQVFAPAN